jgi:cell wall-associated NlpC family hydrolase
MHRFRKQRNQKEKMAIVGNRLRWALIIVVMGAGAMLAGCGGYSAADHPSREPDDDRNTPGDAGKTVVKMAEEYIGAPYRSGGTTTNGVDCSGLAFAVYRKVGVKLPRTSDAQARAGNHIDRGELRAGDLVFFGSGSNVSHVGIYADGGEFIHASTRARSVRFDRLDNKYFRNRYIGARRVL